MYHIVYINHDRRSNGFLNAASDRVEYLAGKVPDVLMISTKQELDIFLKSEGADYVAVDNFFLKKRNADVSIIKRTRKKFPNAKIVSYFPVFAVKDSSLYDILIGPGFPNGDDLFDKMCVEISLKIKPE